MIRTNDDVEPCLSVVMPVYNEAATVARVVECVLAQRPVLQLIAVDDGSVDGTWSVLEKWAAMDKRVCLVRHPRNFGKGMALRTGFARATA
ncbi:MAG: glycosyltransferase family 2 protein, partial [Verrucomicrobiae bacterium]|nr:glycosyltransferase family 2 protein [Verrucomicrobiae bacterium]